MSGTTELQIVSVDHLETGLVVTFSNGHYALYSATLLYSVLTQATALDESTEDGSENPDN